MAGGGGHRPLRLGLKMAGVKEAHHTYFYAVTAASEEQRQEYLHEAYRLGREF